MRRFILFIAVSLTGIGLLFTMSPYILRVSGWDAPVKRYLVKKVLKDNQSQINADKLYFGINNLDLEDFTFVTEDGDLQVHIDRIRFHFNFWKLWTNPKHPQYALRTIFFLKPSVVFRPGLQQSEEDSEKGNYTKIEEQFFQKLNSIPSVGRIQIRNGSVSWQAPDKNPIQLARDISGWIDTKNMEDIIINATGKLSEEDKDNVDISARVNVPNRQLYSSIILDNYYFSASSLPGLYEQIPLTSGYAFGRLTVQNKNFVYDSTRINGKIDVKNVDLETQYADISDLEFSMDIKNNTLIIDQARGMFATDHPFEFEATVNNILEPDIQAELRTVDFSLDYFNRYLKQIPFNGSRADINMMLTTKAGNPSIEGTLKAEKISIFSDPFKNCQLYFKWNSKHFDIDHLTANWHGLSVLGNASYHFSPRYLKMEINGFQHLGEHVVFNRISNKIQKLNISAEYYGSKKQLNGEWIYSLAQSQDTVVTVGGSIIGNDRELIINSEHTNISQFEASMEIDHYLSDPVLKRAQIINLPMEMLSSAPVVKDIFSNINTEMSLTGSLNDLRGKIFIAPIKGTKNLFSLNTRIKNLLKPDKEITGDINLKNIKGAFEVFFNNQFLGGDFNLGKEVKGELYLDITKEEQLYGKVEFDKFNITRALTDSMIQNDFRSLGNLNGDIEISGTVYEPKIEGRILADKFVFNDIGYYQARMDFHADRSKFQTDTLTLSLNNVPIMAGSVNWTLLNNMIDASIEGHQVDLPDLLRTFDVAPDLITGEGAYTLKIGGKIHHPQMDAEIRIKDGTLREIPFDEVDIKLTDIIRPEGNLFNKNDHFISLEKFYISEQGRYHLHSIGKLPLNTRDEMDIVLNFDGDLFGLIPYWHSFFKDGASLVDLSMNIRGTTDNMHIEKAEAKIERGELWLGNVARHVEGINGKIVLQPGTNQIDFIDFEGAVDDNVLFINTVRDIVTENGRKLEHWYFEDLDLDFGILALETTSRGVELHIPGLMEKEEVGSFGFSGRHKGEKFYFAGPVSRPLAYGDITTYNSRVTFPFIINDGPEVKKSVAVRFLTNMEWDVKVLPGEDILYFRDIPAYIDEVKAELFVDESSEGLQFTGSLNNGTFKTVGKLESTRGRLEYLDQNFRVELFNLEFTEGELLPDVSGRAWTTIRDSVGAVPKTIYLQLYVTDPETGQELDRGNWENFKFKLVSLDPQIGETQEQVLAYMGYSVDNIREKATSVGGAMTEKYLIRPLLRPLERALERNLGMDMVRFNSSIAKNLFYGSMGTQRNYSDPNATLNPFSTSAPYLFLMQSSEVTLGKYLTQDIYLTYTGQLVSVYDQVESGFDFNHSVGLEYRFMRNILLEFEYDRELMGYYRVMNERQYMEDFKIRLRHSFSF